MDNEQKIKNKKKEDLEFIRKVTELTNVNKIVREINVNRSNVVSGRARFDTIEFVRNKLENNLKTILGIDENENNN